MNLWIDTGALHSAGKMIQAKVSEMTADVDRKILSRGTRVVNELRNSELEVLRGERSGRTYRVPYSKKTYTASAPGEPPARRTGNLRLHWNGNVEEQHAGPGIKLKAVLESGEEYAAYLENGTRTMAPRPFVDRIVEKAMPGIKRIMEEPYK